MTKTVKDEIIEQVDCLAAPQQRKVLDYARRGSIDPADLEAMSHAIQEGCEKIEPNGW